MGVKSKYRYYPSSPYKNKYVKLKLKTPNHQDIDGKDIRVGDLMTFAFKINA